VPARRSGIERQDKIDEILDVAAGLVSGGFDGLSVAAVSRELGLAQNSIYWYFPTKDELFAAAARRLLAGVVARKPPARSGTSPKVVWVTDQMAAFARLRADIRDRAVSSPAVAELHSDLEGWIRQLLLGHPIEPDASGRVDKAEEVFLAAVDGILARGAPKADRQRLVRFAYDRLLAR